MSILEFLSLVFPFQRFSRFVILKANKFSIFLIRMTASLGLDGQIVSDVKEGFNTGRRIVVFHAYGSMPGCANLALPNDPARLFKAETTSESTPRLRFGSSSPSDIRRFQCWIADRNIRVSHRRHQTKLFGKINGTFPDSIEQPIDIR
jgi:hypothetical protein